MQGSIHGKAKSVRENREEFYEEKLVFISQLGYSEHTLEVLKTCQRLVLLLQSAGKMQPAKVQCCNGLSVWHTVYAQRNDSKKGVGSHTLKISE